jgi:hypothetical protein
MGPRRARSWAHVRALGTASGLGGAAAEAPETRKQDRRSRTLPASPGRRQRQCAALVLLDPRACATLPPVLILHSCALCEDSRDSRLA